MSEHTFTLEDAPSHYSNSEAHAWLDGLSVGYSRASKQNMTKDGERLTGPCEINARCLGCQRSIVGCVQDSTCESRADCALKGYARALSGAGTPEQREVQAEFSRFHAALCWIAGQPINTGRDRIGATRNAMIHRARLVTGIGDDDVRPPAGQPDNDWRVAFAEWGPILDKAITRYGEAVKDPSQSIVEARVNICDAIMDLVEAVAKSGRPPAGVRPPEPSEEVSIRRCVLDRLVKAAGPPYLNAWVCAAVMEAAGLLGYPPEALAEAAAGRLWGQGSTAMSLRGRADPPADGEMIATLRKIVVNRQSDVGVCKDGSGCDCTECLANQLIRRLRASLREAPPQDEGKYDLGWLIEDALRDGPWYYCGVGDGWTRNHLVAIRFSRREDADRMILALPHGWHLIGKAVEHSWLRREAPSGAGGAHTEGT